MTSTSQTKRLLRRTLRLMVWALVALTLYYFATAVAQHWSTIAAWRPGWLGWAVVLAAVFLYATLLFLLAELWHQLVQGTQNVPFARRVTYPSFTKTQIAKYLPGNVFQFAGRHLLMTGAGAGQRGLVLANLLEIATLALAATLIILLGIGLGLLPQATALFEVLPIGWLAVGGVVLAVIAAVALALKLNALPSLPPPSRLATACALAVLFFVGMGLTLLMMVRLISGDGGASVLIIAVLSWLAGYITPGAPGGLGVREFVMLFLLRPHMPEADAVIVVGLFRVATSLGDLLFFVTGELLWRGQSGKARTPQH